jgi:hypothetical protein
MNHKLDQEEPLNALSAPTVYSEPTCTQEEITTLIKQLRSWNRQTRDTAMEALRELGTEPIEQIVQSLKDESDTMSKRMKWPIRSLFACSAITFLLLALGQVSASTTFIFTTMAINTILIGLICLASLRGTRQMCILLAESGGKETINSVGPMLMDKNPAMQSAARRALLRLLPTLTSADTEYLKVGKYWQFDRLFRLGDQAPELVSCIVSAFGEAGGQYELKLLRGRVKGVPREAVQDAIAKIEARLELTGRESALLRPAQPTGKDKLVRPSATPEAEDTLLLRPADE